MTQSNRKYILTVSHNIFLTREQRHFLTNGKTVEVIGVSLPVWICKDDSLGRGYTTEPAIEVFCKYVLTNKPYKIPLHKIEGGYQVNVPQLPESYKFPKKMSNSKWRKMTEQERETWYEENKTPLNVKSLLDIENGGSEYLRFEEYNIEKINDKFVTLAHFVKIQEFNVLEKTIERDCV